MSNGLDVIIIDDDSAACESIADIVNRFYSWGDVFVFTDDEEAALYCMNRKSSIAIFIVDVFLADKSGFLFLDTISGKYKTIHDDTIMITGNSNDDVVDMCVAAEINHLLEKPIRPYALQLAVRAIASKYMKFANRLLKNKDFLDECKNVIGAFNGDPDLDCPQ
ncbi:MAG: response regulator [Deltaproteobacteria bacterium]|nr:response regulator [Deltaproteobacteria bacterium]